MAATRRPTGRLSTIAVAAIRLEAPSWSFGRVASVADRRTVIEIESVLVVSRAMHGDHDAFATLIGIAADRLYQLACLILRDSDRAEDAAQEAVVQAWRELPRLRDPGKFDAWLRKLTVNACFDEARRVQRRAEVSLIRVGDRSTVDPSGAYVEHDRVDRAFRRLPFDQRAVLVLQHHFDQSHTEIAETLGIPLGTVKARIRYGSAALRASLDADDRASYAASDRTSA